MFETEVLTMWLPKYIRRENGYAFSIREEAATSIFRYFRVIDQARRSELDNQRKGQ